MSFSTLNKKELLYAADFAGVDVSQDETKVEIIAALEEAGFSWTNYKKFVGAENRQPGQTYEDVVNKEIASSQIQFNQMVLLKMERQNPTFEILGRRFTKQQPFQVMSADAAQEIIDLAEQIGGGFRIATPAEAKSYFS